MSERDPANELYDRACGVLAEAIELSGAAARPGGDAAIAATLGCLGAAMGELTEAYRLLERTCLRSLSDAHDAAAEIFGDVVVGLEHARAASDDARTLVGPRMQPR